MDAALLRALLEHGLPRALSAGLDPTRLDDTGRAYLIRALLERGRRCLRAADFERSAQLSAAEMPSPEQPLYHALSSTLKNGPRDPSQLLLGGPFLPTGTGQVAELEHLATAQGDPSAPLALFDAAYTSALELQARLGDTRPLCAARGSVHSPSRASPSDRWPPSSAQNARFGGSSSGS
jgi:hypothetical protein